MYQPRQKDHPVNRKSKGSGATKSEEDRGTHTYVYRWMPQELLHGQPVRHVNRVLEEREGDCMSTQPKGTASVQGRKAQNIWPGEG